MTDCTALLGCGLETDFTDPIPINIRFSFISVYINLRLNWQCLWGYSPGRQFWRHFVCIWLLKLCLFALVLAARARCDWAHRKAPFCEDAMQQWPIWSTVPRRELKSCIAACSSKCADVKRRSKIEDAIQLNHSCCFIVTDLSWCSVWIYLFL